MIRGYLQHISKSKPLRAVLRVLSLSGFFCDAPNLTPSDKKLGRAGGKVCSVKSLRLFIREFREFREFKDLVSNKTLTSLISLNSLTSFRLLKRCCQYKHQSH